MFVLGRTLFMIALTICSIFSPLFSYNFSFTKCYGSTLHNNNHFSGKACVLGQGPQRVLQILIFPCGQSEFFKFGKCEPKSATLKMEFDLAFNLLEISMLCASIPFHRKYHHPAVGILCFYCNHLFSISS